LLSPSAAQDENRLFKVLASVSELNKALGGNPQIGPALTTLERITRVMEEEFEQIDEALAKKRAKHSLRQVIPEKPAPAAEGSCENIDYEEAKFDVRQIRIDDPFRFLPWVREREQRAETQIINLLQGKPFTYSQAAGEAIRIIEAENFLPDTSEKTYQIKLGNC
jgi:hypothetical protein